VGINSTPMISSPQAIVRRLRQHRSPPKPRPTTTTTEEKDAPAQNQQQHEYNSSTSARHTRQPCQPCQPRARTCGDCRHRSGQQLRCRGCVARSSGRTVGASQTRSRLEQQANVVVCESTARQQTAHTRNKGNGLDVVAPTNPNTVVTVGTKMPTVNEIAMMATFSRLCRIQL